MAALQPKQPPGAVAPFDQCQPDLDAKAAGDDNDEEDELDTVYGAPPGHCHYRRSQPVVHIHEPADHIGATAVPSTQSSGGRGLQYATQDSHTTSGMPVAHSCMEHMCLERPFEEHRMSEYFAAAYIQAADVSNLLNSNG